MASLESAQAATNTVLTGAEKIAAAKTLGLTEQQLLDILGDQLSQAKTFGVNESEVLKDISRSYRREQKTFGPHQSGEAFLKQKLNSLGANIPDNDVSGLSMLTDEELERAQNMGELKQDHTQQFGGFADGKTARYRDSEEERDKARDSSKFTDTNQIGNTYLRDGIPTDLRSVGQGGKIASIINRSRAKLREKAGLTSQKAAWGLQERAHDKGFGYYSSPIEDPKTGDIVGWEQLPLRPEAEVPASTGTADARLALLNHLTGQDAVVVQAPQTKGASGQVMSDPQLIDTDRLLSRMLASTDSGADAARMGYEGREAVRQDNWAGRSNPEVAADNVLANHLLAIRNRNAAHDADVDRQVVSYLRQLQGLAPEQRPAKLGRYPMGFGEGKGRVEPAAVFNRRPYAVQLNEDSLDVARALGADTPAQHDRLSGYVDFTTGEPITTSPNSPGTAQQLNIPQTNDGKYGRLGSAWVEAHTPYGDPSQPTSPLRQVNISQTLAELERSVLQAAPDYRNNDGGTAIRSIVDLGGAAGALRRARDAEGKEFWSKDRNEKGKKYVVRPTLENIFNDTRSSLTGQKYTGDQLAQIALALRNVTLAGAEPGRTPGEGAKLEFGTKGYVGGTNSNKENTDGESTSERASISLNDVGYGRNMKFNAAKRAGADISPEAAEPAIGSQPSFQSDPVTGDLYLRKDGQPKLFQEPLVTKTMRDKETGKLNTADEAVAKAAARNASPERQAYIRNIYETLPARQAATEEANAMRALMASPDGPGVPPMRQAEDAKFMATAAKRAVQVEAQREIDERSAIQRLITEGAQYGSQQGVAGVIGDRFKTGAKFRDAGMVEAGRKLDVPGWSDSRLTKTDAPSQLSNTVYKFTGLTPVRGPVQQTGVEPASNINPLPPAAAPVQQPQASPADEAIAKVRSSMNEQSGGVLPHPPQQEAPQAMGVDSTNEQGPPRKPPVSGGPAPADPGPEPEKSNPFSAERRRRVMENLSRPSVRIGGGVAAGAGLLAALIGSNNNNEPSV